MAELDRKISTGMGRQGRNNGNCRNQQRSSSIEMNVPGSCRGTGMRQGGQSNMSPADSVVKFEETFKDSGLQLLRAQAEKMMKALENIQEQIRSLTEK